MSACQDHLPIQKHIRHGDPVYMAPSHSDSFRSSCLGLDRQEVRLHQGKGSFVVCRPWTGCDHRGTPVAGDGPWGCSLDGLASWSTLMSSSGASTTKPGHLWGGITVCSRLEAGSVRPHVDQGLQKIMGAINSNLGCWGWQNYGPGGLGQLLISDNDLSIHLPICWPLRSRWGAFP